MTFPRTARHRPGSNRENVMRSTLLIALACSAAAIATPALGQTADDQATTGSGTFDPSQTIIVTGSRVSDRTVADSPVPVDVIGGQQLPNSGYSDTNKVPNQDRKSVGKEK